MKLRDIISDIKSGDWGKMLYLTTIPKLFTVFVVQIFLILTTERNGFYQIDL